MIYLGLDDDAKSAAVEDYIAQHGITKVFVISPDRFAPAFAPTAVTHPDEVDGRRGVYIPWPLHIEYRYYYRVLQAADPTTLVVLNEVLRGQQRTMLSFNCIRTFLRHANHQLVFQYLPIIDSLDDVMTLVDFDTRSRWWDQPFSSEMLKEVELHITPVPIEIVPVRVPVDEKTRAAYSKEKTTLLAEVRGDPDKDPHLIPRNLLLVSGKAKLPFVDPARRYVGRNNRVKLPNMETFRDAKGPGERVVFELPHNVIELADLLTVSRQSRVEVLVADTKTEDWYLSRFQGWAERVRDATLVLHG